MLHKAKKLLTDIVREVDNTIVRPSLGPALAQLWSSVASPTQARAAQYIQERAAQLNSRILSTLAQNLAEDPFAKVKQLISDLLVKLQEEALAELNHKGWCDKELSTNELTRTEKAEQVSMLHEKSHTLTAKIATETANQEEATNKYKRLQSEMDSAKKDFEVEKATHQDIVDKAKEATEKLTKAIVLIKDHYRSPSLIQKQAPGIAPYQSMVDRANGVLGLLESIQSDFARTIISNENQIVTLTKELKDLLDAHSEEKAKADASRKHAETQLLRHNQDLKSTNEELSESKSLLDSALAYYEKLKPSCVVSRVSHEDRRKRREEEMASLKEALEILSNR